MLRTIAIVAATAAVVVASSANAVSGGCDDWGCGSNGTQVTGIAFSSVSNGNVSSVILPSGETVEVR